MDNKIRKELKENLSRIKNMINEDLSDLVYNVDLIKERVEKVENNLHRLKVGLKNIDDILIQLDGSF